MKIQASTFLFFFLIFCSALNVAYAQRDPIKDSLYLIDLQQKLLKVSDKLQRGKINSQIADIYRDQDKNALEIRHRKAAVADFLNVNDSLAAENMYNLQELYQETGQYAEALDTGLKELKLRKEKFPQNSAYTRCLREIGYTYDRMNEYETAILWQRKALKSAQIQNHLLNTGWSYGCIGIAYDELAVYDSALFYNLKAVEYFKRTNEKGLLSTWYSNIANTYTKRNDLNNAEKFIRLSLELGNKKKPKAVALVNLGKILLDRGKLTESQLILDSALRQIDLYGDKRVRSEVYYRLSELNEKKKNLPVALEYFKKFKQNEDEMFTEEKANQINEMSVQYETAEKEKEILTQRAFIAEKELQVKRRGYSIFGISGLALGIGLLGFMFWNRQKARNIQLQQENELKTALQEIETQNELHAQRTRISRDLHDNIGSQLTFIISSVDNLKHSFNSEDERIQKKLNRIMKFTSETILDLRDTIWAMNQSEISFEDLKNRVKGFLEKAHDTDSGIQFTFDVDESVDENFTFNSVMGMNTYRIIQEAVNNAIKYAQADEIKVTAKKAGGKTEIEISDNGKGMNSTILQQGNGLAFMQKRAAEMGSELKIFSSPEFGTSLIFEV